MSKDVLVKLIMVVSLNATILMVAFTLEYANEITVISSYKPERVNFTVTIYMTCVKPNKLFCQISSISV